MENPSFHLEAVVKEKNQLQDFEGRKTITINRLSIHHSFLRL